MLVVDESGLEFIAVDDVQQSNKISVRRRHTVCGQVTDLGNDLSDRCGP